MNIFNLLNIDAVWVLIIDIILLAMVAFPITMIILENRNPIKTLAWMLVLLLLPFIGLFLYFYFGKNYRKVKIFTRKEVTDAESSKASLIEIEVDPASVMEMEDERIRSKIHLMKLLVNNSKSMLTGNNSLKILNYGKKTFASIIRDIENAKHHIHLEFYIIEDDHIGNTIKNHLIKKAREGIEVRIIYDDVGSWSLTKRFIDQLNYAGAQTYSFMPVKTYRFANKLNYRNHRKIIVIDGAIGYVGGLNIADRYDRDMSDPSYWRDTHLRIEGDAVKSLQFIFLTDWFFMSRKLLNEKVYFPVNPIKEKRLVQISASGPDSDWASIMQTYFSAIATAYEYVYISTPYFLPNESILTALKTAALSGIDVRIILPKQIDTVLAKWSSRSYIEELLESGIRVYFYKKGFTHSKLLIVDDVFTSIGTANMDVRSFDQNFEVNALVYDRNIAEEVKSLFFEDLTNSELLSINEYSKRPFSQKLRESVARLFSPLL
ncbi:MAG: cardiolipin synthase [Bacteroidia bacterium]|nr:cardiolipin synthase [Bacteroidia bacterium]